MDGTLIPAVILFSAWLLMLAEFIGVHFFVIPLFRFGPVVQRRIIDFPGSSINVAPGTTIKRETGKYRFSDSEHVYFLGRSQFFEFKWRTPFPCKFTGIVESPGRLAITCRLPVGPLIFFLFTFLGWVFLLTFIQTPSAGRIPLLLFGACFFLAIFGASYAIERGRNRLMLKEIQQILAELNFMPGTRNDQIAR